MRKRNFMFYCDTLFWYIVYMLPVIVLLLSIYRTGEIVSLSSALTDLGITFVQENIVFDTISSVFGTGGVFPIFSNPDVLLFLTYFCYMIIIHLVVDVIVFIPRLAHKWIDKFCKKEFD